MDTITTTQSLLKCNGCAQPVMVSLTANETRLIAAAPELLAAAKMSLQCLVLTVDSGGIAEGSIDDCIDALRAAIAKAEGGQDE